MNLDDLPATLTVEQTAKLLGISRGLAYEAVRRGEIPSLRLGRRLVVPRPLLLRILDDRLPRSSSAERDRSIPE